MNKKLLRDIEALKKQAKANNTDNVKFKVASGNRDSLTEVIKTREQADFFMKMLKSL